MVLPDAVFDEIESVRSSLPIGQKSGHVVIDRQIGIRVDGLAHA